jgi:hypothetical protein
MSIKWGKTAGKLSPHSDQLDPGNWVYPWHHPPHLVGRGFYIFLVLKIPTQDNVGCLTSIFLNVDGSKTIA